jgi:predicted phosphodiesterase
MKIAVIADVHANLAALESVLAHIRGQGADAIWCLGDLIGYGPDPRACIQAADEFTVNILGDHEEAVCLGAVGFNPVARIAIDWTRKQLNLETSHPEENRDLWNFIGRLEKHASHGPFLLVHASPREPTREYLFGQDCRDSRKMDHVFSSLREVDWRVCLAGHTHQSGVFVQGDPCVFLGAAECGHEYRHAGSRDRILVSVGSVGQPRDGDWRASYVTVDDEFISFHRVEYDRQRTIDRYREFPELPERLAHLPGKPISKDELAATGRLRDFAGAERPQASPESPEEDDSPV